MMSARGYEFRYDDGIFMMRRERFYMMKEARFLGVSHAFQIEMIVLLSF